MYYFSMEGRRTSVLNKDKVCRGTERRQREHEFWGKRKERKKYLYVSTT
jgi:hypothetical protein